MRWFRLSMALALLGLGAFALLPAVLAEDGPEHLRPGPQKITREVNQWRAVKRLHRTGNFYLCDDSGPPFLGTAGYARVNRDDANDCQNNVVYQTAMNFDLSDFREVYGRLVPGRATLTWDDTMNRDEGEGEPEVVAQVDAPPPSCVGELGRPTIDWSDANDLIPNESYGDRRGAGLGSSRWDVTSLVRDWLRDPETASRGVLLKGFDESLDAENDDTDCFSYIRNPRLELEYVVAPALAITSVEVFDKTGAPGCRWDGPNTVSVVVHNNGSTTPSPPGKLVLTVNQRRGEPQNLAVAPGPGQDQELTIESVTLPRGQQTIAVEVDDVSKTVSVDCGGTVDLRTVSLAIRDQGGVSGQCASVPDAYTVIARIENLGDADPGYVKVQVLVDGKPSAEQALTGFTPNGGLLTKEFTNILLKDPGTHQIQIAIDPDKAVPELNEANNLSEPLTVTCSAPEAVADVAVWKIHAHVPNSGPGVPHEGATSCVPGSNSLDVRLQNQGAKESGRVTVQLRAGTQPPLRKTLPKIAGLTEEVVTFDNVRLAAGPNTVTAELNPDQPTTADNKDKKIVTTVFTCSAGSSSDAPKPQAKQADLQIDKIEVQDKDGKPGPCKAGLHRVEATIKNAGQDDPGSFDVQVRVDNGSPMTTTVGGVTPGSTKRASFANVELKKGDHTLVVTVDPGKKVTEGDEQNNSKTTKVTCS